MSPRHRYRELAEKVDAFFQRVHDRHRDAMDCGAGCDECCHTRFSVSLVEAAEIRDGLAQLTVGERETLALRAVQGDPDRCAALDQHGRCGIYAWRPLVCRSHGVPIRAQHDDGKHRLPVVESCHRNFRDGFDDIDPGAVLDQQTLSTVLAAIDIAYARAEGLEPGTRVSIAELLASSA